MAKPRTAPPPMVGAMSPPVRVRFTAHHDYRVTPTSLVAYLEGMRLLVPADHARSALAANAAVEDAGED